MGWSLHYELRWAGDPSADVHARIASLLDGYDARRGERSEPLALALSASPERGAVKIHFSSTPEGDYRALVATLAAIADALPGGSATISDEYYLLTGADPRTVRIEGGGRSLRVHDEAALPPPRDASIDVLREALRRAERVASRARDFKSALGESDLAWQPGYPQNDENALSEALRVLEEWLRAHA
jgi:hypothetical protein